MLHLIQLNIILVAYLGICSSARASEQNLPALRSAYLYYFSYFIEWPTVTRFPHNELVLCALTDSNEDRFQLKTIDNKPLHKNRLAIKFLDYPTVLDKDQFNTCHMLYVATEYNPYLAALAIQLAPDTLLITEGEADPQGGIHLQTRNKKLTFDINIARLKEQGLKASSKLLRLGI